MNDKEKVKSSLASVSVGSGKTTKRFKYSVGRKNAIKNFKETEIPEGKWLYYKCKEYCENIVEYSNNLQEFLKVIENTNFNRNTFDKFNVLIFVDNKNKPRIFAVLLDEIRSMHVDHFEEKFLDIELDFLKTNRSKCHFDIDILKYKMCNKRLLVANKQLNEGTFDERNAKQLFIDIGYCAQDCYLSHVYEPDETIYEDIVKNPRFIELATRFFNCKREDIYFSKRIFNCEKEDIYFSKQCENSKVVFGYLDCTNFKKYDNVEYVFGRFDSSNTKYIGVKAIFGDAIFRTGLKHIDNLKYISGKVRFEENFWQSFLNREPKHIKKIFKERFNKIETKDEFGVTKTQYVLKKEFVKPNDKSAEF